MSKFRDELKNTGRGYQIPDVIREDLPELFVELGFKRGVEIGTARGHFAKAFCKQGIFVHCVDPYCEYDDYRQDGVLEKSLKKQYEEAKERLAPYPNHEFILKTSMQAVKDFRDESIDFVYIDGNHGFKYVTEDIYEWSKKVRKGGIISGHDYIYTKRDFDDVHVKWVVDAYTKAFRINNWFLLGGPDEGNNRMIKDPKYGLTIFVNEKGERRNRFRSWMWIKE